MYTDVPIGVYQRTNLDISVYVLIQKAANKRHRQKYEETNIDNSQTYMATYLKYFRKTTLCGVKCDFQLSRR